MHVLLRRNIYGFFFKNTVGNKASMAPKCPVMGADFSKMETNGFPFFFGCSFLPFRCRGWNGVRSGSRKVIQQEVELIKRAESGVTVSSHWSDLAFFGPAPFLQREKKRSVSINRIRFGIRQACIVHFERCNGNKLTYQVTRPASLLQV